MSSLTLFYNTQFIAESFVFSAGAALYACTIEIIRSLKPSRRFWCFVGAVASGAALLLLKQSGALYLYLIILFPLLVFENKERRKRWKEELLSFKKSVFWRFICATGGIIALSFVVYRLAIPSAFFSNEMHFTGRWVMSMREILTLPFSVWAKNISSVTSLFTHYYSIGFAVLLVGFLVYTIRTRDMRDVLLSLFFLGTSVAITFLLTGFNEYMYHTATIVFSVAILGRIAVILSEHIRSKTPPRWFFVGTLAIMVITVGWWLYQDALIEFAPVRYLEQSTPWAESAYLIGWSSGYGVSGVVDFLKTTNEQGTLVTDPQWGNPGTSLQVYNASYPKLTSINMPKEFISDSFLSALASAGLPTKGFIIYSDWFPKGDKRLEWRPYAEQLCKDRRIFTGYKTEPPIVVCKF